MHDVGWPVDTPRDEVLARVVTRGRQLKAVRRTVVSLVASGIVAAGVLGVGILDPASVGNGQRPGGGEVATGWPDRTPADEPTSSTSVTGGEQPHDPTTTPGTPVPPTDGSTSTSTPDTPRGDAGPGAGASDDRSDRGGSPDPSGPSQSPTPPPTTPAAEGPTTSTTVPPTTEPPGADPTEGAPPLVGVLRTSAGVADERWTGVCDGVTTTRVSVQIAEAESVVLSWNYGAGTNSVVMDFDGAVWTAELGPFDPEAPRLSSSLVITITAVGPGGTTRTASALELSGCLLD